MIRRMAYTETIPVPHCEMCGKKYPNACLIVKDTDDERDLPSYPLLGTEIHYHICAGSCETRLRTVLGKIIVIDHEET